MVLIILWAKTVYRLLMLQKLNHSSSYSLVPYEYFHSVKKKKKKSKNPNPTEVQEIKQNSAHVFPSRSCQPSLLAIPTDSQGLIHAYL